MTLENLFSLIGILKDGAENLQEFKDRGFLLIDAIECRICKNRDRDLWKKRHDTIINYCKEVLRLKIELLGRARGAKR